MRLLFPGKRYSRLVLIAGVVLLVILLGINKLYTPAGPRSNPLALAVSVPDITDQAAEIVEGKVYAVVGTFNSQWNSDSSKDLEIVYTDYRLLITANLKGELKKGDTVVLRSLGKDGNNEPEVADYNVPNYQVGRELLLFLQKSPTTDVAYMAVDGDAGVFLMEGSMVVNQQDHQKKPVLQMVDQVRKLVGN